MNTALTSPPAPQMFLYRDKHGSRSSTMPRLEIVVDGQPRAYVSFNGKVFEGTERGWKSDPYASA